MARARNLMVLFGVGALLLVAGYFGARFMAENMAEQKVREFFAGMDDVAHAEYGDVEVSLFRHEAVIHDLNVAVLGGKTIQVREFVLSRYEEKDGLPQALKVRFGGVVLPVSGEYFGDSVERLQAMGYDEFHCDYALEYEYREKEKTFDLAEFSLTARDAGQLGFSLKLANVNLRDLVDGGPSAMLVGIGSASLRYTDDSLLDRALRTAAEEQGLSREQLLEQVFAGIDAEIERNRQTGDGNGEFAVAALEQLRAFIGGKKSISVRVAPAEPVAVLQLMGLGSPAEVVKTLDLQVAAN